MYQKWAVNKQVLGQATNCLLLFLAYETLLLGIEDLRLAYSDASKNALYFISNAYLGNERIRVERNRGDQRSELRFTHRLIGLLTGALCVGKRCGGWQ